MKETNLSLANPFYAYLFGFIQTDGHLYQDSRNRGRLMIELQKRDKDILLDFQTYLPFYSSICERTRQTNFKNQYDSVICWVFNKRFRDFLLVNGMCCGKKSKLVTVPRVKFSTVDYFRGLIDGDGSLGFTRKGFPFLSFVSASSNLVRAYLDFLGSITGKIKTANQNKRDGVFNIAIYKEDAQKVVKTIYYENCLALLRKILKAKEILSWNRPPNMRKVENKKRWTDFEDNFILSNPLKDAMSRLDRTQSSIVTRLWRLKTGKQLVTD